MKITLETINQIPALRATGKTNKEICSLLGMKHSTYHYWVRRLRGDKIDVPRKKSKGRPRLNLTPTQIP